MTDSYCPHYCGVACIDGSCPMANVEKYEAFDMDVILSCRDCPYYRGCEDCYHYDFCA